MSLNRRKAASVVFVMMSISFVAPGQERGNPIFNPSEFRFATPKLATPPRPSQPSPSENLKLISSTFVPVREVALLPDPCKIGFAKLTGQSSFELANPGEPYQATDVVTKDRLPWRCLILGGTTSDRCVIYYEKGGFGTTRAVVVINISKAKEPTFVWGGIGGAGPGDLASLVAQITHAKFDQGGPYSW